MLNKTTIYRFAVAFFFSFALQLHAQDYHSLTEAWGNIDYKGRPWVDNLSRPYKISHGLYNRHLSIWASHGMYYDQTKGCWKWQRPYLFSTTEDLYTQTIVLPYLIPMLENAGATVFSPRERDWQKHEIIIDNDTHRAPNYIEVTLHNAWQKSNLPGFSMHEGCYYDGENPFTNGTSRLARATKKKDGSFVSYQPDIPEAGRYAVYVSYQTLSNSIDDAQYIVYHRGQQTEFRVNQTMGSGTWVYLGTFDFDAGCNEFNRVIVTNHSRHKNGIVTTDAVRFGGGVGNIIRGERTSGMPRALEGARYYAQWAGVPYSIYSTRGGTDDYSDDINTRSLMSNWLAGGSVYVPTVQGLKVPLELALAIHSDAGYRPDGETLVGPLAICTTNFNDGRLSSGISRMTSKDFASSLLNNLTTDLQRTYGTWDKRYLWDRNYSETRLPEVPSVILETLSHQSFPDMRYGQDPNFRFTLARSVYKSILRYVNEQHGRQYVVQPLPPEQLSMEWTAKDKVKVSWTPQEDPLEPTARPRGYIVYVAEGRAGFDNGTFVGNATSHTLRLEPGIQYSIKVTACNQGGESFPSETLSAIYHPDATKQVLVVNGFHRLSSPAIVNNATQQGFDLAADAGVSYGLTAGWSGQQLCYDRSKMGREGESGLGYSGSELEGHFVAGNDFNYPVVHVGAIGGSNGRYNVISCSAIAVENGRVDLGRFDAVDLILGLEKNDGHSLKPYKTFSPQMQQRLRSYTQRGGNLLVSGSYIGSDMLASSEQEFLSDVLKLSYLPADSAVIGTTITGLGTSFDIFRSLNHRHYAVQHPEILQPLQDAFCAMLYQDGRQAAVAYQGPAYRTFTMGFPFECIQSAQQRSQIMQGIMQFLLP